MLNVILPASNLLCIQKFLLVLIINFNYSYSRFIGHSLRQSFVATSEANRSISQLGSFIQQSTNNKEAMCYFNLNNHNYCYRLVANAVPKGLRLASYGYLHSLSFVLSSLSPYLSLKKRVGTQVIKPWVF